MVAMDATLPDDCLAGGPNAYLVAQGICFLKRSRNPCSTQITKVVKAVGTVLHTTGKTWRGQQGRIWAQMAADGSPDDSGWVLVEGPGFGVVGPLLLGCSDGMGAAGAPSVQVKLGREVVFECLVPPSATVSQLLQVMCARTRLTPSRVILTKAAPRLDPRTGVPLPADFAPEGKVLRPNMLLRDVHNGEPFLLHYCGDFKADYHKPGLEDRPVQPAPSECTDPRDEGDEWEEGGGEVQPEVAWSTAIGAVAPVLALTPAAAAVEPQEPAVPPPSAPQNLDPRWEPDLRGDGKTTCMHCGARAVTKREQAVHLRQAGHDGFYMCGGG